MKTPKTLDKDTFVTIIANKINFAKKDVYDMLDAMTEVLEESVASETPIKVRGLGELKFSPIRARDGYDPFTGKKIKLKPSMKIIFELAENIRFKHKTHKTK